MTVAAEAIASCSSSGCVTGVTDSHIVVVEITLADFIGKVSAVGLRIIAQARCPIHMTLEAGWIFSSGIMADGAVLNISSCHLGVASAAGSDPAGQGAPVGSTMPDGTNALVGGRVVALGAEVTRIDLVAGQTIRRLATCFDPMEEAEVQTVDGIHCIHGTAIQQWREG